MQAPEPERAGRRLRVLAMAAVMLVCLGCEPINLALAEQVDLLPPTFDRIVTGDANTVTIYFDEAVTMAPDAIGFDPPVAVRDIADGETVTITTGDPLVAGTHYTLHATVRDALGNTTTFVARFWGFNPRPPALVINEFTPRGSKKRRDAVELYVTTGGNLGGVTLYDGVAGDYRDHVVLPAVEVAAGDYIVIHATVDGLGEDEVNGPDSSSHEQAVAGAWDFWLTEGGGLSGNNGVITVYAAPDGPLIDGVLYSNRTSDSDERYRGFGSKATMARADRLAELGGWQFGGERIAPEDAISSASTTSTRSLCRDSASTDSDSATDWHTVPTRGATFGAPNSDDVHDG